MVLGQGLSKLEKLWIMLGQVFQHGQESEGSAALAWAIVPL